MAPHNLDICLCNIRHDITTGVIKLAPRRLCGIPLLSVLGGELTEFRGISRNGHVFCISSVSLPYGGTEKLEAGGYGEVVELGCYRCGGDEEEGWGAHGGRRQ